MSFKLRSMFYVLRCALFLLVAVVIMSIALLELIFAPMLALKYFLPSLNRHGFSDTELAFFYISCFIVQLLNFLASSSLFVHSLLTGYHEKWFAFDTFTLLSCSLSIALVVQQHITGIDRFRNTVERDIYLETARLGDQVCRRTGCRPTDIYIWHQQVQCCGWHSAADLAGIHSINDSSRLFDFCCHQSIASHGNAALCRLDSPHRFRQVCHLERTSFLSLRSVSLVSHPCSFTYSLFKVIIALAFTAGKKHSFIPQAEGLYSFYVPP
ncbi:hypothetical protein RDWZM_005634 [Blomia tropicalis]|uniref:Uncharacterized protein n=1 Tax=Blomia tropicalis TaxID=40697 RepID=A0A9Q0M879_BLOTA|nr:hypothetical protein RDWZM_005634 [Blomia tropicalis]